MTDTELATTDIDQLANETLRTNAARAATDSLRKALKNNTAVIRTTVEDGLVHITIDPDAITFAEIQRIRSLAFRLGLVGMGPRTDQSIDPSTKLTFGLPNSVVEAMNTPEIPNDATRDVIEIHDEIADLAHTELTNNA